MKSKLSGSVIEFNPSFSLKLKDEIGSGSFSYVYSTDDPRYVVKMINAADPKSKASYNNEKFAFETIPRHENIVNCPGYRDSLMIKGINYCCFALENCSKGSIISMIVDKKIVFQEHQIFKILFEVVLGLHQMHTLSRPIAHRDLKGENVLLGEDGHFKLTDFGSISTRRIETITEENRDQIQEDIDKNTTPTIRGPEQCDLYSRLPITEKVDIWAVGCLLYILCYQKQPFESKLATVNCKYFVPDSPKYSNTLLNLFPILFRIDPRERPSTYELVNYFETQMKNSLKNFVSNIGDVNEQVDSYNRMRGYQTVTGVQQNYSPPEKMQGKSNKEALRIHLVNSDESKVKPLFKDVLQKYLAKLMTKTEAWMLSALEENQKPPGQTYVQHLVIKAWVKPLKIQKFYNLLHKKYTRNPDSTIIVVKALITLHTYFRKGPNDVYLTRGPPSARSIIHSINQNWKTIFAKNQASSKDKARNTYSTQLIVEYSDLLLRKYDFQIKFHRTFQGNYALDPYFLMPVEENSPISAHAIENLLALLEQITTFHQMLFQDQHLLKIQCSIASSVLDEEYCIISVLTHLIATFKQATNFIGIDDNAALIEKTVRSFEERFEHSYEKASQFFESCRRMHEFQQQSTMIPQLPPQLPREIREILILMDYRGENFQIKKFLNENRSFCNLSLPRSYEEVARNFKPTYSPDARPRNDLTMKTSEHKYSSHRAKSKPMRVQEDVSHFDSVGFESRDIYDESPPKHHPVRSKNGSLHNLDKPNQSRNKGANDFDPHFDNFNFGNNQINQNKGPSGREVISSNNVFDGFNFNAPQQGYKEMSNSQTGAQNFPNDFPVDPEFFADDAENRPEEDLSMVFSHQFVNTSFIKQQQHIAQNIDGTVSNVINRPMNEPQIQNYNNRVQEDLLLQNNLQLTTVKTQSEKLPGQSVYSSVPLQSQLKFNDNAIFTAQQSYGMGMNSQIKQDQLPGLGMQPNNVFPQNNNFQGLPQSQQMQMMPREYSQPAPSNFQGHPQVPQVSQSLDMRPHFQGQQNFQNPLFPGQFPHNFPQNQPGAPSGHRNTFSVQMNEIPRQFNPQPFQNQAQPRPNMTGPQQMQNMSIPQQNQNNPFQQNIGNNGAFGQNNMMQNIPGQGLPGQMQFNQSQPQPQQIFNQQQQLQNSYGQQQAVLFNQNQMQMNNQLVQQPGAVNAYQAQPQELRANQMQEQIQPQNAKDNAIVAVVPQVNEVKEIKVDEQVQVNLLNLGNNKPQLALEELDFLFQKEAEKKVEEVKKEENKELAISPGNDSNEWDVVFNIESNAQAQKQIEQEKERQKKEEEEAKKAKEANVSLVNTPNITSTHLQKFIFQEISKNAADWVIDYKQLKFISQIGTGGSAEVYHGLWRGTDVAIKKMKLNNLPESRKKEFEREISALMKLRPHQNLINFMGVSITDNELCVIMEFCYGGTLFEWLHVKKNIPITWKQKIKMAVDVACGMNYLHTSNPPIIHRDLKSLNLLVDGPIEKNSQRFVVKIADFGLAKPQELNQDKMTGIMGTYHWMAPEIFENKDYTIKADVYSFGVVLYEIVTRETPYPNLRNPAAIMKYVTIQKGRPDLACVPNDCPKQLIDLMVECWHEDPDKRPHFSEVLERLKSLEGWHFN